MLHLWSELDSVSPLQLKNFPRFGGCRNAETEFFENGSDLSHLFGIGLGKFAAAITPLRRLLQERPDMSNAPFNLGRAVTETGPHDDAVASLKEAVRLEPTQFRYYAALVPYLAELGRLDEAREYDEQATALGLK